MEFTHQKKELPVFVQNPWIWFYKSAWWGAEFTTHGALARCTYSKVLPTWKYSFNCEPRQRESVYGPRYLLQAIGILKIERESTGRDAWTPHPLGLELRRRYVQGIWHGSPKKYYHFLNQNPDRTTTPFIWRLQREPDPPYWVVLMLGLHVHADFASDRLSSHYNPHSIKLLRV